MMSKSYSLPPRKARVCRVTGAVLLLTAALTLAAVALAALLPGGWQGSGEGAISISVERPFEKLSDEDRAAVLATPAARARFEAYAARPAVRAGLAAANLLALGPYAVLLIGFGTALRRLGGRAGDPLARALPWLKLGSLSAIAWALAQPASRTAEQVLLSGGAQPVLHLQVALNLADVSTALTLALAAFTAIWAIEAGLKARAELDDFV